MVAQFQPREFSAIMGADICCVRAELPVRPLPRLFRSFPGVVRPPDMKAPPPRSAGLPDCLISDGFMTELDRRWLCLRFLYLRAIKNIAAPYAADPPMAAIAIPAVAPVLPGDWFCSFESPKTLPLPDAELEDGELPLPVPVEPPLSMVEPGVRGIAGFK